MELIADAQSAGARIVKAAELLGLTIRTIQRWRKFKTKDRRKGSRAIPANKISAVERVHIVEVLLSSEFKDSNPNQIVPTLADRGIYLGSESTMYRILKEQNMSKHRSSSHPATRKRPKGFFADGPNQVWSWDITYCAPSP